MNMGFNKSFMLRIVVAILVLTPFIGLSQLAQVPRQTSLLTNKRSIVCYASGKNVESYLAPPKEYLERLNNPSARGQAAKFHVDYVNFSTDAQTAFQRAVDIWASLLQSPVTINVLAVWQPLTSNNPGFETLGQATWGSVHANFDGAQKLNVYYPAALADKLAGKNLGSDVLNKTTGEGYDIVASFNSNGTWNYSERTATTNQTHLTTVVLHELGHGLGFVDSYDVDSGNGSFGIQSSEIPIIFDVGVENGSARVLDQTNRSPEMGAVLTNQNITYNSPQATAANGAKAKLYAPSAWVGGSSIAHLDQATYTGTSNTLMRPTLDSRQVTLEPGPIVKSMFSDMGWQAPVVTHTPLPDTEDVSKSFTINAIVASDGTSDYSVNSVVKLRYTINSAAEVEVDMTKGSNNAYTAQLPAPTQTPTTYAYYIVTTDNLNRTFTKPGKIVKPGEADKQSAFVFTSGPDVTPPDVKHTPLDFIKEKTPRLQIKTIATDNIGIKSVSIAYKINDASLQNLGMTQDDDTLSLYKAVIPTLELLDQTTISYRITATDNSSNRNQTVVPSTSTFFSTAVIGVLPAQINYSNDFNSPTKDFFGNGFSITKPEGFDNGAIHSLHPYPEAKSGSLNFTYQLRVPIKVNAQEATIRFDEIVLVEPGKDGAAFGTDDFFDYVVTEGSIDGGKTWKAMGVGYDSRDNADWLATYTKSVVADISQGVGTPSLFRPRSLNLLSSFKAGDEVQIRFRLYSDAGAAGWGWAIDNLKIQIDESGPVISHNHVDYIVGASNTLVLNADVIDGGGIDKVYLYYSVGDGPTATAEMALSSGSANTYSTSLDLAPFNISATKSLNYRIWAVDVLGNKTQLPNSGFFNVPRITFGTPQNSYTSDFNSTNTDFVGNFFSISTPSGFADGAIQSAHPYLNGFGLTNSTSAFTYTLTTPITLSSANPYLAFDEVAIVEPLDDYVNVEGSKDNGVTWRPFLTEYSASSQPTWSTAYNAKSNGSSSLYKSRLVNMLQNENFKSGDQVLIRFRLNANATVNAWGWAIDNLSIQGPITNIEKPFVENSFSVYPNPSNGSKMLVKFETLDDAPVHLQIIGANGSVRQSIMAQPVLRFVQQEFFVGDWSAGLYIVKADVGGSVVTRKFVKAQ